MDFETHTALTNLPKLYDDAICRKDYDAYADVFTEDGVWDAGHLFVAKGKQEIYDRFKSSFDVIDWVVRLPLSTLILECDGAKARIRTYFLELINLSAAVALDPDIQLASGAAYAAGQPKLGVYTYTDDCVKQSDGTWRISLHKIHIAVFGDLALQPIQIGFPIPA